jgi:type I restriction enzyme S subunit
MKKQLPKNWGFLPFTEIFDINGGTQPPKAVFIDEPKEGYIRLLQIRDFGKKPVPTYIPDTGKLMTCKKDDILIARYGASIGRIVTGMEGSYNVALAKVSVPENMDKNFVKWLLKSNLFQEPILSIQRTAQNGFNKTDLASIYIPLPPLAEQNRIVAKLDTLFTQLETIKASMAKVPLLLKDFRQQVLSQAVTGKLTKEWRKGKDLGVISLSDEENKIELYHSKISDLIPSSWKILKMESVSNKITDGEHLTPKRTEKGEMLLSAKNVRDGYISYSDFDYISKEDFEKCLKRCKAEIGDILIVSVGATIGRTAIVVENQSFALVRSVALIKPSNLISSKFLMYILQSEYLQEVIEKVSRGSAQSCLYINKIAGLPFPYTVLDEQQEIVSRVESLFAKADAIEQQYKSLKEKIDNLPQALLHKAFKGELTDQLDTDGDAKDLLKEIQNLKTASKKIVNSKLIPKKTKVYSENKEVLAMVAEPK